MCVVERRIKLCGLTRPDRSPTVGRKSRALSSPPKCGSAPRPPHRPIVEFYARLLASGHRRMRTRCRESNGDPGSRSAVGGTTSATRPPAPSYLDASRTHRGLGEA